MATYQRELESAALLENTVEDHATATGFWASGKGKVAAGAAVVGTLLVGAVFALTIGGQQQGTSTSPMRSSPFGDVQIASRTAPLFLDAEAVSAQGGLLGALVAKYAPSSKVVADVPASSLNLQGRAKGDPAYWVMYKASMGSTCDASSVISVAGMAGLQCTPYLKSSVAAACVYGQVYLATFPDGDYTCSNEAQATVAALGPYDDCTKTSWGSIYTACDMPSTSLLSGYDVMSVYTANTTADASAWCKADSSLSYGGTLFEGFPINDCILGMSDITEPNSFVSTSSLKFGYKDTIFTPTYTTFPSDENCGVNNQKQETITLDVECSSLPGDGSPTYYKWYYRV